MTAEVRQRRLARLERLRDERFEGNARLLANAIKRSPSQVSQWFTGVRTMTEESARHIERSLNMPPGWLDTAEITESAAAAERSVTEVIPGPSPTPSGAAVVAIERGALARPGESGEEAQLESLRPGEMWLQKHEGVYPRMGRGGMDDGNEVVTLVRVNEENLRRQLGAARITSLQALRLVTAFGDSMRPTFDDGDMLVIDTGVQSVGQDGIYLLRGPEDILVKRVQRKSDGAWLLISSNREYETERVEPAQRDRFAVLGRVVFAWRGEVA
jgi:plasmid maintenance system antidote protein VapI